MKLLLLLFLLLAVWKGIVVNGYRKNVQYNIAKRFVRRKVCTMSACSSYNAFVFGIGYVGEAFVKKMRDCGIAISGTCVNDSEIQNLRFIGIDSYHIFDTEGVKNALFHANVLFHRTKAANTTMLCYEHSKLLF